MMERLRFNVPLEFDFGRTERPMMPAAWGPVERATVGFGHGIAVTPMHLLLASNAMVNGGIYIYPTILRRTVGAVRGTRVITPEISAELREVLFRTTVYSTGRGARVEGINIGGKTSTAEKRDASGIRRDLNITSFVVTFPIEAPQYTMLIILDEPRGIPETHGFRTSAWNAVPTTQRILDRILPILFTN
jgi:cell division protein FtsI (penicillin-binding protein 3)